MEKTKLNINIEDNFLNEEELSLVHNYCYESEYHYGEKDTSDSPYATGMVNEIYSFRNQNLNMNKKKVIVFNLFREKIEKKFEFTKNLSLYRMYVNCFSPLENPLFHTDGTDGDVTFLFYINEEWNVNDGGETQFYFNNTLYGIPPQKNRLVWFNANLLHKASSFKNKYRFSVAIKYTKNDLSIS
jgi:Rps23 Pro-64 3,4-dihydroxylase Tpa1-like proline 4-hydroxylase